MAFVLSFLVAITVDGEVPGSRYPQLPSLFASNCSAQCPTQDPSVPFQRLIVTLLWKAFGSLEAKAKKRQQNKMAPKRSEEKIFRFVVTKKKRRLSPEKLLEGRKVFDVATVNLILMPGRLSVLLLSLLHLHLLLLQLLLHMGRGRRMLLLQSRKRRRPIVSTAMCVVVAGPTWRHHR